MINLNKTLFVWLIVGMSVLFWAILAKIYSISVADVIALISLLPTVVTLDCILVAAFVKWVWRWRIFYPWLVPFPDLNGVWKGEIRSTHKRETAGDGVETIPATLHVRQTFTAVSCVMTTNEMRSDSCYAALRVDHDNQLRQLIYVYCSRPKMAVSDRSTMHDGAATFDITGEPPVKLTGRYWTTRCTTGDIELKRSR